MIRLRLKDQGRAQGHNQEQEQFEGGDSDVD